MEVVAGIVVRTRAGVGAVEADHIAVLIFNPDAAIEAPHAGNLGMNVEDPGADRSQEFAAHIAEYVMLLIEARGIEEHHLHEAGGIVSEVLVETQGLGQTGDGSERSLEEAFLACILGS